MEKLSAPVPVSHRADLTARRVGGRSTGTTEKAKASGNALDKPTSVGSEMARESVEPIPIEKANDDRRQSVDASQSCCPQEQQRISAAIQALPSGLADRFSCPPNRGSAAREGLAL